MIVTVTFFQLEVATTLYDTEENKHYNEPLHSDDNFRWY